MPRPEWITSRRLMRTVAAIGLLLLLGAVLVRSIRPPPDPAQQYRAVPAAIPYALIPLEIDISLDRPVDFVMLPGSDDQAIVPLQGGQIWRIPLHGGYLPTLAGDISDLLITDPGFEEGLVGLALSPDFAEDGRVYLAYAAGNPRRSVLSRFLMTADRLDRASEEVLIEIPQPFSVHNVGQLAFGPDGYLYVGVGDGGSSGDELRHAQDRSTLLGAILRIDVSGAAYEIPPDNPFVDDPDSRPEIYAYGLRNPWRFSFDRETGTLWAGDVGEVTWEEVNQIFPGANYGWNVMEGHACFMVSGCDREGLAPPRAVYTRDDGCSITGGYVYRGSAMPELVGSFIYGDFCTGAIWAVPTLDDGRPVRLVLTGVPIVTFGELSDGELVVVGFTGQILQLQYEVR
jgi:glucose/arabinose dehydrogenase